MPVAAEPHAESARNTPRWSPRTSATGPHTQSVSRTDQTTEYGRDRHCPSLCVVGTQALGPSVVGGAAARAAAGWRRRSPGIESYENRGEARHDDDRASSVASSET